MAQVTFKTNRFWSTWSFWSHYSISISHGTPLFADNAEILVRMYNTYIFISESARKKDEIHTPFFTTHAQSWTLTGTNGCLFLKYDWALIRRESHSQFMSNYKNRTYPGWIDFFRCSIRNEGALKGKHPNEQIQEKFAASSGWTIMQDRCRHNSDLR